MSDEYSLYGELSQWEQVADQEMREEEEIRHRAKKMNNIQIENIIKERKILRDALRYYANGGTEITPAKNAIFLTQSIYDNMEK